MTEELVPRMYVKFNGTDASEQVTNAMISIEVDDSLTLPDMFAIHLRDPNLSLIDEDTFSLGTSVEISAQPHNGGSEATIFTGEVTAIEPRFNLETGPGFVLRGYDKSHRLNRNRTTRTFLQMTDSDIATRIAQDAELQTNIDATRQVHEYVIQDNKTDWEFLIARAQRIGYHVMVRGDTLHFVQAPSTSDENPTLVWAEDLIEFDARLSAARQVSEVVVQGWDPDNQQQIVGQATTPNDTPQIGQSEQGGPSSEQAFGTAREIIVDRPVSSQAEADALAQSICDEIGQGFIQAECACHGNPAVQTGVIVQLDNLGNRFSGTYRVTHALHRYSISGYRTEFTLGGRHTTTIRELLSSRSATSSSHCPVLGVVTNNQDPQDQGRVKVRIPSINDGEESAWARLVLPGAGNERGLQWLPEVGDEVLVLFEHEEIHAPLVIGGLWSSENPSPIPSSECLGSQGEVNTRQLVSRTGMKLVMSDDSSSKWIEICNGDESLKIKLSETDSKIEIVSNGDIDIKAESGKVAVTANEAEVSANTKIELKVGAGAVKLEASGVEITNGQGATIGLSGPTVSINNGALEVM